MCETTSLSKREPTRRGRVHSDRRAGRNASPKSRTPRQARGTVFLGHFWYKLATFLSLAIIPPPSRLGLRCVGREIMRQREYPRPGAAGKKVTHG